MTNASTWRLRCACGAAVAPPPVVCKRCGGISPEARFWQRVEKTASCWLWQGCKYEGYGRVRFKGRSRRAHQVAWELTYGPIPDGVEVCHNCPDGDNPICVNPAHLWLGSHQANVADALAKGRMARGERMGPAKLKADQVLAIRARYAQGDITCAALGALFGVSGKQVNSIINQHSWKHLLSKAAEIEAA